jgi:hypothetical protein
MRPIYVIILAMVLAGCNEAGGPSDDTGRPDGSTAISVGEARAGNHEGPVLVKGYLFVDAEGKAILADAILESYPPQPGGALLEVEGIDLADVEGLQTDQGRSWTNDMVELLGTVEGKTLVVGAAAG